MGGSSLKPYYQEKNIRVYLGDCLQVMPELEDKSIDAVITDIPYGRTACNWDVVIPFEPMWEQLGRLTKDNGVIVTTASQPFTSMLIMSNLDMNGFGKRQ
jgi:site-specific DNA-methyltransferase (adenine-specific)